MASKISEKNLESKVYRILPQSNDLKFQLTPESDRLTNKMNIGFECLQVYDREITLQINLKNLDLID